MLNSAQLDVFRELINIGMGQTAALLSDIADERVVLSVTQTRFLSSPDELLQDGDSDLFRQGRLVMSTLQFGCEIRGAAHLCFPSSDARNIVRLFMGDDSPAEAEPSGQLNAMEEDAMLEIGNILLNGLLGAFANLMQMRFEYVPPTLTTGAFDRVFTIGPDGNTVFLVFYTLLALRQRQIGGTILLVLSLDSVPSLKQRIDQTMEDMML